ncbi:manganese transporter Smf2p [Trichomonascus vanleenenianus]|uniref:NRAMP family metal ion transporter n=1 Tax=Trichomonascus vanleenenianus TaxID=2268995 RepID=UPI003ECB6770
MNCPTKDPNPKGKLGHFQNPSPLDNDLISNSDISPKTSTSGGDSGRNSPNSKDNPNSSSLDIRNSDNTPEQAFGRSDSDDDDDGPGSESVSIPLRKRSQSMSSSRDGDEGRWAEERGNANVDSRTPFFDRSSTGSGRKKYPRRRWSWRSMKHSLSKYAKFFGPGIMVSVAYMDPGNYSTAVSAGALYQYKLLFVVLVSNLFAVFLQILCAKLGSVTGRDLAQNCRDHLPRWLCISIYFLAEIAIIATDLAEVVGTAISLNILFGIPLAVGVALTVIDVLLVLMAYQPNGPLKVVRYFEYLVAGLVTIVVVCFAIELAKIGPVDKGAIFEGFFLPHKELFQSSGLYLSCGILGATVMPHSLYLGSGLVQPRLREYDTKHGYYEPESESSDEILRYKPSIYAIRYAMNYSIAELVISLFTVAIFVNAAILIVAGATLSNSPDDAVDADLFSIYEMLQKFLGAAAGTVFALALLFSGQSAGIVCTLSGQMVSEGFLHWSFKPWIRRLITRAIAIAPCFAVAIFVGRKGLADVLNASQVVLSLMLPFVSAPLLFFTASKKIMRVPVIAKRPGPIDDDDDDDDCGTIAEDYTSIRRVNSVDSFGTLESDTLSGSGPEFVDMSNSWWTNVIAISIFLIVSALNLFLIISMAMGADVHL